MKRLFLCLTLLMLALPARAETETYAGRVREDMPSLTLTVTQQGERDDTARRPYTLAAHIAAEDGSLTQEIVWQSNETPLRERLATLVRLVDYNFDGYADLQLLTAQGASEVFYVFALWNPAAGRFDDITTLHGEPLMVDHPIFIPERREIRSVVHDGWRYRAATLLCWQDDQTIVERVIAEVYDPGMNGYVGERMTLVDGDERRILWDQVYEEDWYYSFDGVTQHRDKALAMFTMEGRYPFALQVTHEDWVYLRSRDDISSEPLAQLPHGTTVHVLLTGLGQDGGWVMVWHGMGGTDEVRGQVGYIWHSFLGLWPLRVTGADWVYLREAPDKQASALLELDAGTLVWPNGDPVDGWTPVSVRFEDRYSCSGYIWHSFLEETEY